MSNTKGITNYDNKWLQYLDIINQDKIKTFNIKQNQMKKIEKELKEILNRITSLQTNKLRDIDIPYTQSRNWAENPINSGRFRLKDFVRSGLRAATEDVRNYVPNLANVKDEQLQHNKIINSAFAYLVACRIGLQLTSFPKQPIMQKTRTWRKVDWKDAIEKLKTLYTTKEVVVSVHPLRKKVEVIRTSTLKQSSIHVNKKINKLFA
jgi:hypothetical protein